MSLSRIKTMKAFRTRAERLEHAMELRGVRSNELNRLAGLSQGYVSRIVNGQRETPGLDELRSIADVLRVRFEWLAFGRGMMDQGSGEQPAVFAVQRPDKPVLEAVLAEMNGGGVRWGEMVVGAARSGKKDHSRENWPAILDEIAVRLRGLPGS